MPLRGHRSCRLLRSVTAGFEVAVVGFVYIVATFVEAPLSV